MFHYRLPYLALTAVYCAAIFLVSGSPDPPGVELGVPGADKVEHIAVYAGLALLVAWGVCRSNERPTWTIQVATPAVFSVLYGVTDELHQVFIPHRSADLLDLAADAAGALIAAAVVHRKYLRRDTTRREGVIK